MRRYQISVNNTPYDIDIEEVSATEFEVDLDGQRIQVTLDSQADAADAVITPKLQTAQVAPAVEQIPTAPKVPKEMRSAKPRTPSPAVAGGAGLAHSMTAPMPGVILEIAVSAGQQVSKGDVVMVLEAMKMKNDLHASQDGVIAEVCISAGDQVKYGQPLLRFAKD